MPDPVTLGTSIGYAALGFGGAGAIGFGLFGKKKKQETFDPLGPIRQQLVSLAEAGLPVAQMRERIERQFGRAREKGMRDIGEEVYAAKELPGSIHANLVTDLLERLEEKRSGALLDVDIAGKRFSAQALTAALGGQVPTEAAEEPGFLESFLPEVGEFTGDILGKQAGAKALEKLLGRDDAETKLRRTLSAADVAIASDLPKTPKLEFPG